MQPEQSSRKFSGTPESGGFHIKDMHHLKVMVHQSGNPERDRLPRYKSAWQLAVLRKATPLSIQSRGHHIFPASGYRNNSNGSLSNVGSNGYYWSASANNSNNGHNLNFNSSNWNWNNNNRSNGFPVRAVAEAFSSQGLFFLLLSLAS